MNVFKPHAKFGCFSAYKCHCSLNSPMDVHPASCSRGPLYRVLNAFILGPLPHQHSAGEILPLHSHQTLTSVSSCQWDCYPLFRFPFLFYSLKNAFKQKPRVVVGLLCLLLAIGDHNPTLLVVQCLETIVSHIVSSLLVIYSRKVSLVPVTSSRLKVQVPVTYSNVRAGLKQSLGCRQSHSKRQRNIWSHTLCKALQTNGTLNTCGIVVMHKHINVQNNFQYNCFNLLKTLMDKHLYVTGRVHF